MDYMVIEIIRAEKKYLLFWFDVNEGDLSSFFIRLVVSINVLTSSLI